MEAPDLPVIGELVQRLSKHLSGYKAWIKDPTIKHCSSVHICQSEGLEIKLLEAWPSLRKTDLEVRENYWGRKLRAQGVKVVNVNQPAAITLAGGLAAYAAAKSKKYYELHRAKINMRRNAKFSCPCGGCYTLTNQAAHARTGRHCKWLEKAN